MESGYYDYSRRSQPVCTVVHKSSCMSLILCWQSPPPPHYSYLQPFFTRPLSKEVSVCVCVSEPLLCSTVLMADCISVMVPALDDPCCLLCCLCVQELKDARVLIEQAAGPLMAKLTDQESDSDLLFERGHSSSSPPGVADITEDPQS